MCDWCEQELGKSLRLIQDPASCFRLSVRPPSRPSTCPAGFLPWTCCCRDADNDVNKAAKKNLQLLISRLTKLRWMMLLFPNATHQPISDVILHNISILNRVKYLWTKVTTTFLVLITKLNLTLCRQTVPVSGYMARGRWSVLCGNIPAPECLCGFASSATLLWAF